MIGLSARQQENLPRYSGGSGTGTRNSWYQVVGTVIGLGGVSSISSTTGFNSLLKANSQCYYLG